MLNVEYLAQRTTPSGKSHLTIGVPESATITINVVILPGSLDGTLGEQKNEAVSDIYVARERYAPVGVRVRYKLTFPTYLPAGVDFSNGLQVTVNPSAVPLLSVEAKTIISEFGTTSNTNDTHIFYVPDIDEVNLRQLATDTIFGCTVHPRLFANDTAYGYNVFVVKSPRAMFTTPHEFGHVLGLFHVAPTINVMTDQQGDFGNHISSDKRFDWTQQLTIYIDTNRIKKP